MFFIGMNSSFVTENVSSSEKKNILAEHSHFSTSGYTLCKVAVYHHATVMFVNG